MSEIRKTCFVIQQFDGDTFDRRFDETLKPAIEFLDIKALRADKILGLQPIIEKIEENIQKADICLADVSIDNPNVWLELGYALALDKPTVIICDKSYRENLPFDIQHRPVIFYRSDSKSGYDELEIKIKESISNEIKSTKKVKKYVQDISGDLPDNLDDFETEIIGVLISGWDGNDNGIERWKIENHMKSVGYNDLSIGLGLSTLVKRDLINRITVQKEDYNNGPYEEDQYVLSESGSQWIEVNRNIFTTQAMKKPVKKVEDDDLPF